MNQTEARIMFHGIELLIIEIKDFLSESEALSRIQAYEVGVSSVRVKFKNHSVVNLKIWDLHGKSPESKLLH